MTSWESQEWLLGEVGPWLGMEEALNRTCNVCSSWRSWCNNDIKVLHIGNDFQRRCGSAGDEEANGGNGGGSSSSSRAAGLSIPLFLPLVPSNLRELNLSGAWTSLPARELGVVRRGCRLKKLVITGVRLFSMSYRELLLFEHLEELDISDSQMDVPLPRIQFAEPAGGTSSLTASSLTKPQPPPPPPAALRHRSIIAARGDRGVWGRRGSHAASSPGGRGDGDGGGIDAAAAGGDGGGAFDSPRFAASLMRLVAVKTRLWNRWDLSTFPMLASLEVSYAGRTMLKQLHRKAEMGTRLTELSVCDLALRHLVRPTELTELAEAVGGASTFRLRRVDVVKEVSNFAYLRAILGRLHNLQVLELTDVALDDSFLDVLGEVLVSRRPASRSSGGEATATAPTSAGGGAGEPFDFFPPDGSAAAMPARNQQQEQQQQHQRRQERESADGGGGRRVAGGGATVHLRTLVLGRCEGVSEAAFEAFLELAGGGGTVGPREGSRTRRHGFSSTSGGGGGGRSSGKTGKSGGGEATPAGFGLSLSTVRLRGCRELGDRGLALLCAGAKGRLSDIQVAGSLLLTDRGVENMAASCPRLARVDLSGCPGVTSNSLAFLLAMCPALRGVQAWGVRGAGSLSGVVQGREGPSSASAASALRQAFTLRGVDFAWAGPLPPPGGAREQSPRGNGGGGGSGGRAGGRLGAWAGGGTDRSESGSVEDGESLVVDAEGVGEAAEDAWVEDGPRNPCRRGCGAWPKSGDASDHLEICALAPVACLLQADGCDWTGTRIQRRGHLETCPMWQVKCPICCRSVHVKDFGGHVLRHSKAADAPALHPPGCALRAYGCRACRVSVNATAARAATIPAGRGSGSDSGSGGKGDCVTPSVPPVVEKGPRAVGSCYSYEAAATAAAAAAAAAVVVSAEGDVTSTTPGSSSSSSDEGTTSAGDGGHRSATVSYSYEAAAAAAAEATGAATTADMATNELGQDVEEKEGAVEELEQSRARDHDNPGMCPWYRIQCKSCEQEVGRREWDNGEHECPVRRREDVLVKHASGAGKLRNRQWLIVYGYIGTGGKKGTAEGWEDPTEGAFHGVNPMCAMPSVLSATLPLPGPAGAPVSPATRPL